MEWVHATFLGKTGDRMPTRRPGVKRRVVHTVFRMAGRLSDEGKAWEGLVVYLEDLHEMLITQDKRWA